MRSLAVCTLVALLIGCEGFDAAHVVRTGNNPGTILDNPIVRGQVYIPVDIDQDGGVHVRAAVTHGSSNVPITVTVANNVQFTIDSSQFAIPANTAADTLSFGSITVTTLRDNNLKVCGSNGTTQCSQAIIQAHTVGSPGAGVWNTVDGFGAPLSSGGSVVGLGNTNAAILETYSIGSNTHVVHLNNFSTPTFSFSADFSNADVGSYSTTLVIEYDLQ